MSEWFNDSRIMTLTCFVPEWIRFRMNQYSEWISDPLIRTVTCHHHLLAYCCNQHIESHIKTSLLMLMHIRSLVRNMLDLSEIQSILRADPQHCCLRSMHVLFDNTRHQRSCWHTFTFSASDKDSGMSASGWESVELVGLGGIKCGWSEWMAAGIILD